MKTKMCEKIRRNIREIFEYITEMNFISAFVILLYIGDFLKIFGKWYIPLFLMLVGVFGPMLWTSIVRIRDILSVLYLEKITSKQK